MRRSKSLSKSGDLNLDLLQDTMVEYVLQAVCVWLEIASDRVTAGWPKHYESM